MQIDSLKYFTQVADLKSISKVASNSHISQPALSQQLAKLESELGASLFNRSNRGVEITKKGEIVYSYAQRILESYNNLVDEIEDCADINSEINITSDGISSNFIISSASMDIIDIFDDFEVNIKKKWYMDQHISILQNKSDIVISRTKIDDSDVICKKIGSDKLILVGKNRDFKYIEDNLLIALLDDGRNAGYFVDKNLVIRTDSLSTIKSYLENERSAAIVPYMPVKELLKNGEIIDLKNTSYEIEYDIFLSYKKDIESNLKKKILILTKKLESILNKI